MINENILFTVPIYVRNQNQHLIDRENKKQLFLDKMENISKNATNKNIPLDDEFRKYCENNFPGSELTWKYTQIIAFIEIRYEDGIIKAYLYKAKSKRYSANMNKKIFHYCGKIANVCRVYSNTNERIQYWFNEFIIECKNRRYKKWYIDTTVVDFLLPLIDFKKVTS